jgi:hypothetical protein
MSDAIIYATADRGVSAPPYRRRLSQRDSNNLIEPFRALEIPIFSVAILKKDQKGYPTCSSSSVASKLDPSTHVIQNADNLPKHIG